MADLILHAIRGDFVAFNIDYTTYFMRFNPPYRIYDNDLQPQVIPNLDSWIQAHTQQRHGLQIFLDLVAAFKAGLDKSYSINDLKEILYKSTITAKLKMIDMMGEYGKHFWIEVLNPVKLETVWVAKVREKFDELRQKLGDDEFHNYLCRMLKVASAHRPVLVPIIERLIARLGRTPSSPNYPVTDDLDVELVKSVCASVLDKTPTYKNVSHQVDIRLEMLSGTK